jgi:AraC-like DNA-binding protein
MEDDASQVHFPRWIWRKTERGQAMQLRNRGAYSSPFSGTGLEFFPLGVLPDHSGLMLHEAGFLEQNDSWFFPRTQSPFWRLYYNSAPGHRVVFGGREVELTPEHLVLIPDRQLFDCDGLNPVPHLWLHFSVARRLKSSQSSPILIRPARTERALLSDLVDSFSGTAPSREQILHRSLALLLVVLDRPEIQWDLNVPKGVAKAVRHIEVHYASRLSLADLARLAHLSQSAFERTFKRHQGESVSRFIVKVRVREAARRLTSSDDTIDDIAESTGFYDRAYLSRTFKRIVGKPPAEFRRSHWPTH